MYSPRIVLDRIQKFESENKWLPVYHSYEEVLDFTKYIESLIKKDSNSKGGWITHVRRISASRQNEITRWIQNEQVLCCLDSSYWDSRYAWVCDEKGQMFKFQNRKSQEIFDSVISEFDEKQVSIEILCLDPETKVLTADLRWVRLDDVKVGDELVACDEGESIEERKNRTTEAAGNRKKGIYSPKVAGKQHVIRERKMRTTVVEDKWDTVSTALEITFEDGRKITCSPDHQFLYKQRGGSDPIWGYAKKMRIGDKIRSITKIWGESTYEDGWFGGFIDGEGSMSKPSIPGVEINVAQRFNAALERARKYLAERGYGFRQEIDNRSATPSGKLGKDAVAKLCVSRSDEIFRLIGQTRPSRFIGKKWWEGKCLPGKRSSGENTWAVISSIKIVPSQRLVDIQTSTRTFIAEGLVTHNCLKARQLGVTTKVALKFIHRLMFIPNTQAIMASVQKERSELIKRIMDTAYSHCPWWLVPTLIAKNRYDNGSILSIQSGSQAMGLAQGWTPTSIHLCLTPNTLIRVANGMLRPISMVTKNDLVITKEGEVAKIKDVALSPRKNEISKEIWLWGNFAPLGSTLDHPVFTNEGWKRADSIQCGDWVRHPVRRITRTIERFRGTHNPKTKKKEYQGKRFWVHLNPAWGYMCGLYLAEGSCRGMGRDEVTHDRTTGLIFSIHEKEIPEVSARLKEAFGKDQYLGVHVRKNSASAKVTVDVSHLARWVMQNFGAKDEKRVPDWVWNAGRDFCLQLVKGYLDGDGHYASGRNEIHASSIRVQLPIQMRDLIASLGFGWSSIQYKSAGVYYERNCKEQWTLIMNGECGKAFRDHFGIESFESSEAYRWKYDILQENIDIQVESTADGFSKDFYDIEVDHPSHSFLTAQCAVHNSELADYPDPQKMIEEGLFRATHSSRNLFMVLEGTGGGNTGWLADTWRAAKSDWPLGKSRLCPIFIPWAMCPDIYPEQDWLRKFPVPGGFESQIHEVTRKHVMKCESFVRNTPYLAKIAGRDWKMPIEQIHFWQFNYDTACKTHTQKTWAAQMPADDFEALTGLHDSVFDEEVLSEIEDQIYEVRKVGSAEIKERRNPVQTYAIIGHDVDDAFYPDPDMVDYSKEKIKVEWKSFRGNEYEWTMLPLKPMDESIEMNTMDRLMVYEPPQRGLYYACGVDTADGLGTEYEDRTVLSVTNNRFNGESDLQCAEYTTNKLNSAQVVAFAACIGAWYGKNSPDGRGMKYAIEQIRGPGDTCQHQLKMMGFTNHHKPRRYDGKKIKENPGTKEGWYSNGWSVPMLMARFQEAVNGGWYVPRSKWLIEELRTLERHETGGKSKMEHRSGQHDDRVRAAAVSYFTAHDFDILTERAQKRSEPPRKKERPKGPGTANQLAVAEDWP